LPGELFHYDHNIWHQVITPCWLSHTWQYASEQNIQITTHLPSLPYQCPNNQFLMLEFWRHGYKGEQLVHLNQCRLWLQVTTLTDITNGNGTAILAPILTGTNDSVRPNRVKWPVQGKPPPSSWTLWQEAVTRCIPTKRAMELTYTLDPWTDNLSDWKWHYDPQLTWLAECTSTGWRIWIPTRSSQHNRAKYQPTDLYYPKIPEDFQ